MEKLLYIFMGPVRALANTYDSGLVNEFSKSAGLQTENGLSPIESTVAFYITLALGFIGIILFVLTIRAGANWMMAQGDKKTIETSKKTIIGCAIGLFIILSSFSLSEFVITSINKAEKNTFNETNNPAGTDPGTLTKTVCETNSDCPVSAPYCNGRILGLGYCNCCDNDIVGKECNHIVNRHNYCGDTYGTTYLCESIGNGFNTSCRKHCLTNSNCSTGEICNDALCEPGTRCTTPTDCPYGQICNENDFCEPQ